MKSYYDRRAEEYDDWYLGRGQFAGRERPGFAQELAAVERATAALPPRRVLDAACGTGFLTRHLQGHVTGLDQSERMLDIARRRVPSAAFVTGDALSLPFADQSFDRVFTAHFYGHLDENERMTFLAEARRVARELVIVDSALRGDVAPIEIQERALNDGSRWEVLKRYFTPEQLSEEVGEAEVLHAGRWFVAVQAS